MQSEPPLIQVEATAKFQRNLRVLAKKYRSIRNDVQPIIEQLQLGELPGDQIPLSRLPAGSIVKILISS